MKQKQVHFFNEEMHERWQYAIVGAVILTMLLCSMKAGTAHDWPRWRGPDGNGVSKETEWNPKALKGEPKIIWRVKLGAGYSNVSIKNGRLYTMGIKDRYATVFCLNADTGKEIWRSVTVSSQDPQSTPTVDGEFVYALCKEGWQYCLKSKNGKVQWKRHIVEEFQARAPFYGFAGSPVIENDLIILTANTSGMAFNKNTGEKVWGSEKPPKDRYGSGTSTGVHYSTPVIYGHGGKRYAVLTSFKGLSIVEAETGKMRWLFDWEKDYSTSVWNQVTDPIVFENNLFISTFYKYGCFLFDISGEFLKTAWVNIDVNSEQGSPVFVDGYLYICQSGIRSSYGSLRCLDRKTGKIIWEEKLGGQPISLIAAGKNLIILDGKGNIYIAEATPAGYKEHSRCQIPDRNPMDKFWTHPVLCNGKLYCRSFAGELVCIDVSK